MLYRKCCTENAVQKILYRKCCTEHAVQKMLYWKCCTENTVQKIVCRKRCTKNAVQKILYRKYCTVHAVHTMLYNECCTENAVQKMHAVARYRDDRCMGAPRRTWIPPTIPVQDPGSAHWGALCVHSGSAGRGIEHIMGGRRVGRGVVNLLVWPTWVRACRTVHFSNPSPATPIPADPGQMNRCYYYHEELPHNDSPKNCQAVFSSFSLLLEQRKNWKNGKTGTTEKNWQFFTGFLNHGTLEKNW